MDTLLLSINQVFGAKDYSFIWPVRGFTQGYNYTYFGL